MIQDITLERTDTTLDLSQKAKRAEEQKEKVAARSGFFVGERMVQTCQACKKFASAIDSDKPISNFFFTGACRA
jgi:hypothetical protein